MARTKNRLKRNSIENFVAVVVLTIIGLVLSFCSFMIPYTHYRYNGFFNSISLGLDLAGGVSFVYECEPKEGSNGDLDASIEAAVKRLENTIGSRYSEALVTRQGSDRIRIEVPSVSNPEDVLELIGDPQPLRMATENDPKAEARIEGTDIKDVRVSYQNDTYGVSLIFTDEGAVKFENLTEEVAGAGQEIYIFFGDDENALTLKCEQKITGGSTFISGDNMNTYQAASEYALQIMSGTFDVNLSILERTVVSATLGAQALRLALIGGLVGLLLIMLILWLRYGDFGLLASFALVIYVVLMLFFLQAIPFVQLTLPGLAGIILSIGMAVDGTVIIFERFREEYKMGKKIPLAVKGGFKRAFWPIFDSNITTIFTAVILYILGTASIQGFAITLLIGILLSIFMNLVVLRFFVKWYLPFNSFKAKKLHLPKQEKHLKEEVAAVGGNDGKI